MDSLRLLRLKLEVGVNFPQDRAGVRGDGRGDYQYPALLRDQVGGPCQPEDQAERYNYGFAAGVSEGREDDLNWIVKKPRKDKHHIFFI